MKDPARDQVELECFAHDVNRVPGVIPTVEANNIIRVRCQDVAYLPFTFISPLTSDNNGDRGLNGSGGVLPGRIG